MCTPCQRASFNSTTDSFSWGHDPYTLACKARPSFDRCGTSLSLSLSLSFNGVELLLLGAPGCRKVVCFVFFRSKSGMLWLFFHCLPVNHCVCRNQTTLSTTHEYTVRRQIGCLSRASDVIVVVSGPFMLCQWCSDWCALGYSAAVAFGCVWSSHVSGWLRLVVVFAVVPHGVSSESVALPTVLCPRTVTRRTEPKGPIVAHQRVCQHPRPRGITTVSCAVCTVGTCLG